MANEVVYKHPERDIVQDVDFSLELPDEDGLAFTGILITDSEGTETLGVLSDDTLEDALLVESTVASDSMLASLLIKSGVEDEDYVITVEATGISGDASFGTRSIEVRVRSDRGTLF